MNKVLRFTLQLTGFSLVGLLFFVWYLGYRKNNPMTASSTTQNNQVLEGSMGTLADNEASYDIVSSEDFSGPAYSKPPSVAKNKSLGYMSNTAGEPIAEANVSVPYRDKMIRTWKGVHRDASYASICFERFKESVINLSEEHGLYPDIFMARIIAYSYEFIKNPKKDPFDKNFTAMKLPKEATGRAKFGNAFESLKAYAVVNAGEILRLSHEGAIAKHERSWTMQKIIETYSFIKELNKNLPTLAYDGMVGPANKISEEELYEKEVYGEAIKMASKVEDVVKERRAQDAGFTNWEAYIEDMPNEEEKVKESKSANEVISAVSKKKAFNLKRRVAAKNPK